MFKKLETNTVTVQKTLAILKEWKEKVVANVHRGNVKNSRPSSPDIGKTRTDLIVKIRMQRKTLAQERGSEVFCRAISTLTGSEKGKYFIGNCHELSEIAMVVIMLGASKIKCPMKCEIISIIDQLDKIVPENYSSKTTPKDSHVSVRITYPEDESDENTIIVDFWTKDIYMVSNSRYNQKLTDFYAL